MQIRYRFYMGGDKNPYDDAREAAYERLTEEREVADPEKKKPVSVIFPTLDSWPDFVLANSKSVFWTMERAVSISSGKEDEIEDIWNEARSDRTVGAWLKMSEADESEKAMCYYLASLYNQFNPDDNTVDFRLYISEGGGRKEYASIVDFSQEAYE